MVCKKEDMWKHYAYLIETLLGKQQIKIIIALITSNREVFCTN